MLGSTAFLPLTSAAAARIGAHAVLVRAREADSAANACWSALLAGCDSAGNWGLNSRLRLLSEATSVYVGNRWWFSEGSTHRARVATAQLRIEEAVVEGDGQDFACAFVGYDDAMAGAVLCVQQRAGSPIA